MMRTTRPVVCALALAMAFGVSIEAPFFTAPAASQSSANANFKSFVERLWPEAQAAGVTRATFDAAFAGVGFDPKVMAAFRRQPEYGKPIQHYVEAIASPPRVAAGRRKAAEWAETLTRVEQTFAVERWILLGIWGIESDYGRGKDTWDVIRSLATLAQMSDRARYFRAELVAALQMIEDGSVARNKMVGSWAGAMGQPQFMPSDYRKYALDFSGDGRRDIWTSVPDVLASIANHLHGEGWNRGLPWGFEVFVPAGFDHRRSRGSFADWEKLGLRRTDGASMPSAGDAILYFPTGGSGPAFLVTSNFVVIKTYNNSDVYALAAAILGDRLNGGGRIRGTWPKVDLQLSREQRIMLQSKLAALGYTVNDFEGHFDFELRDAIRDVQRKLEVVPDGAPTAELLGRLDELKR